MRGAGPRFLNPKWVFFESTDGAWGGLRSVGEGCCSVSSLCEPRQEAPTLSKSMKVLVVDDYKVMVRLIQNLLKELGFNNVDAASDGEEAFSKMKEEKYGLVISDWNMEPMTGYELLQAVRADDELKDTPFILVTAESKIENVVAAKNAGVNNYIVKPFNAVTLKQKMAGVFGAF
jgi:two-component system chemotaxis response regulator CheY